LGFFGDPHGNFRPVKTALEKAPKFSFFLGDFDLDQPRDLELANLSGAGSAIHFIHGNHDADRESWHDFVFEGPMADRNISGRVIDAGEVRIAGLGGVFHEAVWHPNNKNGEQIFTSRAEYMISGRPQPWRGGLPLRHRSTIFPEDFNQLASLEADILITHEAPSSHRYGHSQIDDLAEILGVKLIVHGHLHQEYRAVLSNGIAVIGPGKAQFLAGSLDDLLKP
jgi:predicted phosphodiesterase